MKTILSASFILVMMIVTACSKDNDSNSQPDRPGEQTKLVDTINFIAIHPYKFGTGYDTSGNYIAQYTFQFHYPTLLQYPDGFVGTLEEVEARSMKSIGIAGYIATNSVNDAKYTVKYVGGADFANYKGNPMRNGTIDHFYLNKEILGKPLFEVYDIRANKLIKRLICAKDSAVVEFYYSVWDNPNITPKQNADALNYFLNVKQTDKIKYY